MRAFLIICFLSGIFETLVHPVYAAPKGPFESSLEKAASSSKFLLVEFTASWCSPCKWMEEHTFSEANIIQKLNKDFVNVELDIDEVDGYELKQRYDIRVLPSFLIFDQNGRVVSRIEETLSSRGMHMALDEVLTKSEKTVEAVNQSPKSTLFSAQNQGQKTSTKDTKIKLQLAVFSDYSRTLKYYNQISSGLDKPLIILHSFKDGTVLYRVVINDFVNRKEALEYKNWLKDNLQLESIIKS